MAKPEKVKPTQEVEEVEETKEVVEAKASKKAPKKEVEEEVVDENVESDEEWYKRKATEADEALEAGDKYKGFQRIFEIHTGISLNKTEAKQALEAFQDFIILNSYSAGDTRFRRLGTFTLVDVGERKGKIKTQGKEKEWIAPAHTTVKFYANDALKDTVSVSADDYYDKVLNKLLIDRFIGEESVEDDE